MSTCWCEMCQGIDAKQTWTREWRHECEVRAVRKMSATARHAFLSLVGEIRGAACRTALLRDCLAPIPHTGNSAETTGRDVRVLPAQIVQGNANPDQSLE